MTTPAPSAGRRLGGMPRRLRRRWRQAISALGGRGSGADPAVSSKAADTRAERDRLAAAATRLRAQAELAEALATGASLESATCRCIEALAATEDWRDLNTAWAVTDGVAAVPGGAIAAALGRVIVLHRRQQLDRAWSLADGIDDATLARSIPVEAVDAATAALTPEARRACLGHRRPGGPVPDIGRHRPRRPDAGHRRTDGGRRAPRRRGRVATRRRTATPRLASAASRVAHDLGPRALPTDAVPFGILGARTPDCAPASSNLGPSIEALATLGNLVRLSEVRFTGDDGLGELATDLQARVDPTLRVPEAGGSIHLVGIDRDFSSVADGHGRHLGDWVSRPRAARLRPKGPRCRYTSMSDGCACRSAWRRPSEVQGEGAGGCLGGPGRSAAGTGRPSLLLLRAERRQTTSPAASPRR